MQIVYISNRPEIAAATLEYVAALMPFLTEAVFVCPGGMVERFRLRSRLSVSAIAEEELLGDRLPAFRSTASHQVRNWLLRSSLPALPALGEELILSDDDYRPLAEIPVELFREAGRYHCYTSFELSRWRANTTAYDRGQRQTGEVLARHGFPTLSYASHMPQMIRTSILEEIVREFRHETERGEELDEWSLYFNTARTLHPDLFHPPRPFRTLCWPALPTDWEYDVRPGEPCFENYYPELYAPGGLFEGLPERFDPEGTRQHSAEKIGRRSAVQAVYDSPTAALLRRSAWALRRLLAAASPPARRFAARWLPPRLGRIARDVLRHGDDPAWSFPSFKTRYRNRRGPVGRS